MTQKEINNIAYDIVACAIEVHRYLGPGLLENIYEECLIEEMKSFGLEVQSQLRLPVDYKGKIMKTEYRIDLLVEDCIIVEIKAVKEMNPIYKAQLLTYLKLTDMPKGLLINFYTDNITKSLISMVTKEFSKLPVE